ncbi:hypothetical protein [Limnobacter sp.]|uniref:hypothetical protein n=1 Tax=Limnobacter sp. TaxID=2003368 RepID=UPI0025BF706E|nr:hypothetical protein [Limnobacter sp.]
MPYLGNIPATQFAELKYQDFTGGTGTSFTLNDPVGSAQELEVFVNNVRQEPGVAYTVSGTALTMTGSIVATDDFYVVFQGKSIPSGQIPEKQSNGNYTFDDGTLFVDAVNNRVGINNTSPSSALEVEDNNNISMNSSGTGHLEVNGNAYNFAIALDGSAANLYTNSSSRAIVFGTNETERARITNHGLTFNGDTAEANALSDYEEGSFTPTVTDTSGNTGSASESTGYYRKIGGLVHVELRLTNINTSGLTGTDDVKVASLPFTHSSRSGSVQAIIANIYQNNINLDYTGILIGILGENQDSFAIVELRDSAGDHDLLVSDLISGSADLLISATYHTEQ